MSKKHQEIETSEERSETESMTKAMMDKHEAAKAKEEMPEALGGDAGEQSARLVCPKHGEDVYPITLPGDRREFCATCFADFLEANSVQQLVEPPAEETKVSE